MKYFFKNVCCCFAEENDGRDDDQSLYYSDLGGSIDSSSQQSATGLSFSQSSADRASDTFCLGLEKAASVTSGIGCSLQAERARVVARYKLCDTHKLRTLFIPVSAHSMMDLILFLDVMWESAIKANESLRAGDVPPPDVNYIGKNGALGFYPKPGATRAGQYETLFTMFVRHYSGMSLNKIMSILYCALALDECACAKSNDLTFLNFYHALSSADSLSECLSQTLIPNHFSLFRILRKPENSINLFYKEQSMSR